MTQPEGMTKADLLAAIDRTWADLNELLDSLTAEQWTAIADAQGWTVKDHLVHLVAWERSAVYFLAGKLRHVALRITEDLYLHGGEDVINAAIFGQGTAIPLAKARQEQHAVHAELLRLLAPFTDADLGQRYRHFLPDEPGEGDGPLAIEVVCSNSANHYVEHRAWIQNLVAARQGARSLGTDLVAMGDVLRRP